MSNRNKPFVFVNFRKIRNDSNIIGIFVSTYIPETHLITIFNQDHHEDVMDDYILQNTEKIHISQCDPIIHLLREVYEPWIDGIAGKIKPVPYLPFHAI